MTRYYINLWGGLGNQLYILAFASHLQNTLQKRVCIFSTIKGRGDSLDRTHRNIFSEIVTDLGFEFKSWPARIPQISHHATSIPVINNIFRIYQEPLGEHAVPINLDFLEGNCFWTLYGCFQASTYIHTNFIDKLYPIIQKQGMSDLCKEITPQDVAIHIRRGDFVSKDGSSTYHTFHHDHYLSGLARIERERHINNVYIFSDDFSAIKSEIEAISDKYRVLLVQGYSVLQDICLLSHFNNYVLANSTFSWWGAYLSKFKEEAYVVVPKQPLIRHTEQDDYYPQHWIKI